MYFTEEHQPAQIVNIYPQASDIFKKLQIDFCCGGDIPLKEQFAKNGINGADVITTLNERYKVWKEAGNVAKDWGEVPLDELVEYIVSHHHAYIKEELEPLGQFVTRVANVHGQDQPHLRELHDLYFAFKVEMEEHTEKEENEVFPLIKQYVKNGDEELLEKIRIANGGLEEEHNVTGDLLKRMREITNGFQIPPVACVTYEMTYNRLAQLEADTFQHVHLENNILFKRL